MQGFFGLLCIQFYWFVWRVARAVHHGRNVKYVLARPFQVVAMCFSRKNGGFWSVHEFCPSTCSRHGRPPRVSSLFSLLPFTARSSGPGVVAARLRALTTWGYLVYHHLAHLHQRGPKGHLTRWQYKSVPIKSYTFSLQFFSSSSLVWSKQTLHVSNNWFQVVLNG